MSITNKLNQIKNAIYGKDVRGAIHDAIKECYDDASVNHDNANMEVKMARGNHNTLNDRLDNVDEIQAQTNAQLSQVKKNTFFYKHYSGDVVEATETISRECNNIKVFGATKYKNSDGVIFDDFIENEKLTLVYVENPNINVEDRLNNIKSSFNLPLVLNEVDGRVDVVDVNNSMFVKKNGFCKLNGTEDFTKSSLSLNNTSVFSYKLADSLNAGRVKCDFFKWSYDNGDYRHCYIDNDSIHFFIEKNMLTTDDVDGFKNFLAEHNITFSYWLKEERVERIDCKRLVALDEYTKVTTNSLSNNFINPILNISLPHELSNIDGDEISNKYSIKKIMSKLIDSEKQIGVKLIGDSITHGVGGTGFAQDGDIIWGEFRVNTNGFCWANLLKSELENRFNCYVKNFGTSGVKSGEVLENIDTLIEDTDDIVILTIGTNNKLDSDLSDYKKELTEIISVIKSKGKDIIVVANIPTSKSNDDKTPQKMLNIEDIILKVTSDFGIDYISLYKEFCYYCDIKNIDIQSLMPDGVHPNDDGYLIMFKLICKCIGISLDPYKEYKAISK